jgi:pimeloyl-ACP methyl ester carboxylesterase
MGSMETVVSGDGTPVAYERDGEGPPLVLVHGTTADRLTWEFVLPELQKHFTTYAVDRRGRGESGNGDGYRIEREFEGYISDFDPGSLAKLTTPTLLLLGGDSPALERTAAGALDAALPDSRIVMMPHQAHLAHRAAPELFVREVVQFLRRA